jgi:hypothetical protein
MPNSKDAQVSALLAEGLDHYGCDEIGPAIKAWRAALLLDPGNAEAIDYLQTADRRDQRRLPLGDQMSDTIRNIAHAAQQMITAGDWEGALDVLYSARDAERTGLEFEAMVEIVRSRLLRCYTQRVGDLSSVPALRTAGSDLTSFQTENAGPRGRRCCGCRGNRRIGNRTCG